MDKLQYGYFVQPAFNRAHFTKIIDPTILNLEVENGGPLFTVDQEFIDGLKGIQEDVRSGNRFYLVEIAGDLGVIKVDPIHLSVFGIVELVDCTTKEEAVKMASQCGRFESVFFRAVMTHSDICGIFPIQQLN